ncbi:lanthionine synthetase C family protein [Yinghuangia sp. YIM S09857]|uniref:lanthionine synthetase C family protein n=1 Tax=Yinghuangia sp. YIM S09857 TaxID=3436929 RepID=UPI003F5306EA
MATTIPLLMPENVPPDVAGRPWWRQSLAHGAPGVALLYVELAARDEAPHCVAHAWISHITQHELTRGPDSHLYYGAPALAHVLACSGRYAGPLGVLDDAIRTDVKRRLVAAHARIGRGALPTLSEFDVIRGLTGLGAYLLDRDPGAALEILTYLVRLTEPVDCHGWELPGWWTASGLNGQPDTRYPHGHANNGVAHGIGGPLALLAHATRRGLAVDGQRDAIRRVLVWLDRWRADDVWPYIVDLNNRPTPRPRQRTSWCYGSAGLARAQQLAALALGDIERQHDAEAILLRTLATPTGITDASLCHGYAGLAHIARCAAEDAPDPTAFLALVPTLLSQAEPTGQPYAFLEGDVGVHLAREPAATPWSTCLLV